MPAAYLLDTSVCVSLIRGHSSFRDLPPAETCKVSAISSAELEVGIHRSSRPVDQRIAVYGLLALFEILPWDATLVSDYAEIRVDLEKRGTVIGPLDLLIAAHARSLGATLITANAGEFRRVKGLKVLAWK
ncbi:MAG: type II toxin-antitoxin system VapC family toxin [Methylacidiphilales bacterium]|nr:type II toxin-antitoxin system VapC family toxin [Candidatus Methylacidiphilales bacterium]